MDEDKTPVDILKHLPITMQQVIAERLYDFSTNFV